MDSLFKALSDREKVFLICLQLLSLLKKILSSVNPASDLFLSIEVFLYWRFGDRVCSNTHAPGESMCSRGDLIHLTMSYLLSLQLRPCFKIIIFSPQIQFR